MAGFIGDSRGILVSVTDDLMTCKPLTRDHKPSVREEAARIRARGGEIARFRDKEGVELGPLRVWAKGAPYPGLAMTRSFGDGIAASVGVVSEPGIFRGMMLEFTEQEVQSCDKIIVIGSDGIWDRLSNDEVGRVALRYYRKNDPEGAVNAIIEQAYAAWISLHSRPDDITCIVAFLNKASSPTRA